MHAFNGIWSRVTKWPILSRTFIFHWAVFKTQQKAEGKMIKMFCVTDSSGQGRNLQQRHSIMFRYTSIRNGGPQVSHRPSKIGNMRSKRLENNDVIDVLLVATRNIGSVFLAMRLLRISLTASWGSQKTLIRVVSITSEWTGSALTGGLSFLWETEWSRDTLNSSSDHRDLTHSTTHSGTDIRNHPDVHS